MHYLQEIWVQKPYVESILQISEGRRFILAAHISGVLILQKEYDVSSSRWLNVLVIVITRLPVSVLIKYYLNIELV